MTCLLSLFQLFLILHLSVCHNRHEESKNIVNSSSMDNITKLLNIEEELLKNLNVFAKQMQKKLNMIKLYQQMLHRSTLHSTTTKEEYVANPLNAYPLLRRLQQDWPKWLEYLQGGATQSTIEQMQGLLAEQAYNKEDLLRAMAGLLRIERIYDLEASHMAKGLLLDMQYNASLNSADCFALGNQLIKNSKYSRSNHWFRTALRLYKEPYAQLYSQVLQLKRNKLNRSFALAISKGTESLQKQPADETEAKWKMEAEKLMDDALKKAKNENIKQLVDQYLAGDEEIFISERARNKAKPKAMETGCRGLWPVREPNRLTCRFVQGNSDFLKLAPLKIETLNEQPLIVLFHQFLSQNEIKHLQNVPIPEGVEQGGSGVAQHYTLKGSRIQVGLSQKLSDILDSDITDQTMHMFNFGFGGYLPIQSASKPKKNHTASNNLNDQYPKNRFGTITFFLNNVVLGGATIFPRLRLTVQPKRGNALIWFNRPEKLAEHAVCPVVIGSRWVISNCFDEESKLLPNHCPA